MKARLAAALRILITACIAVACAVTLPGLAAASARSSAAAPGQKQILVMLKLPPQHFRPGSTYGGYYGDQMSARARRAVAMRIARDNGLMLVEEGWPMPSIGVDCYVMQIQDNVSVETAIARVSRDRNVAWSQPMQVFTMQGRAQSRTGDPLFAAEPAVSLWHLASLHRMVTGKGSTVAVIDSKVDVKHPDLAGQIVADVNFVGKKSPAAPEAHGTGVAAIIAAKANNGVGIAGIAPDARLMALRACWQTGATDTAPTLCNSLSLARALDYAIGRSANVINMSLSGPDDRLLAQLIAVARRRGITVVAAYDPKLPEGGFPASIAGVVAVTDRCPLASAARAIYCAPGDGIPTAGPGGRWYLANGSSFAAAHVSGLIALVRERRSSASEVILVSQRQKGGGLDACATLLAVSGPHGCAVAGRNASSAN